MTKSTQPIPPGHENLIPHLVCSPCSEAIEFYKKAFGAERPQMGVRDAHSRPHARPNAGGDEGRIRTAVVVRSRSAGTVWD